MVDKVALGQVFLRVLRFSPVNINPPLLHIHSYVIWGWTKGPLEAQFHRDKVSPHRSNNVPPTRLYLQIHTVLQPWRSTAVSLTPWELQIHKGSCVISAFFISETAELGISSLYQKWSVNCHVGPHRSNVTSTLHCNRPTLERASKVDVVLTCWRCSRLAAVSERWSLQVLLVECLWSKGISQGLCL
jgi:hypothetical protein